MTVTVPVPRFVEALGQWRLRSGPRYLALAGATRRAITDGRLPAGARIPSERAMAEALGLSRTTVTATYNALHQGGYLERRRGAGSTVRLPASAVRGSWFALDDAGDADIDLSLAALPAPATQLAEALERASSRAQALLGGHGYLLHGLPELRELLAARYRARGLETDAEQILVTAGAQQALAMLFELLLRPLQPVLVESATYPGALMLLRHQRARAAAIPLGGEGWDVAAFADAAGTLRPGLAYLIPDYHNPTGMVMGEGQRLAIAEAAAAAGVPLVVDETFVDLRLHGPPPRPLAAFDPSGETVTVGSLSKSLWGGLRIGWIRAQPHLIRRLAELRMRHDLSSPVLEQLVSAELLRDDGAMAAQRDRAREQRDALAGALRSQLPDVRFALAAGGLSLWLELPAPDSSDLAAAARRRGVIVTPGPTFSPDGALERYLRLPFVLPATVLADGVGRLALCRGEGAGLSQTPAAELVL